MKVDLSNGNIHMYTRYNLEEITELDISFNKLKALPQWISRCVKLQELHCEDNKLVNLPDNLPGSLQTLKCSRNKLVNLPDNLPGSLQLLDCGDNKLVNLPENLPRYLQTLSCYKNKIVNLPDNLPDSLQLLECFSNKLVNLPNILPGSLQTLQCSLNKLVNLPNILPGSLQTLQCSYNKLVNLPENLPGSLQTLSCSDNKFVNLPENLPGSLQLLDCSNNKLVNLPENLPHSLQTLGCSYNKLVNLPEHLPRSLQGLYCSDNKLVNLPDNLPDSLRTLDCFDNKLTGLPISIINCRNLIYINYYGNPIEYIPPIIRRVINRQKNRNLKVYNDTQSVHNSNIQESIKRSIYNLLGDKTVLTAERLLDQLTGDSILNTETKESLIHYFNDSTEHSVLSLTFADLLVPVWERINRHENRSEIKRVLNSEMNDALCKCFTGRISRLVNCLNGFYPDIEVRIGDNEQIGNIITVVKEAMGGEYNVDRHRALVRKELEERGYSADVISEWISFIE